MLSGLLNARSRFGPGALAPVLLNICLISGILIGDHLRAGSDNDVVVVHALAMQRHAPSAHPVTVSIPVLRAVTGAVQPVSRHFITLPHHAGPLEVCAVEPLPG